MRRSNGKKLAKKVVVSKLVLRSPQKSRAPSPGSTFDKWMNASLRDPFHYKPPPLGSTAATVVVAMRHFGTYTLTQGSFRFAVVPNTNSFFNYSIAIDGAPATCVRVPCATPNVFNAYFESGRPLCGGVRLSGAFAATQKPPIIKVVQQPTAKLGSAGQWYNPASASAGVCTDLLSTGVDVVDVMTSGKSYEKLWLIEDVYDTVFDPYIINPAATETPEHPTLAGCVTGADTSTSIIVEAVLWLEVSLRSDVANLFGLDTKNVKIDPNRLVRASEHVPQSLHPASAAWGGGSSSSGSGSGSHSSGIMEAVKNVVVEETKQFVTAAAGDAMRGAGGYFRH